MKCSLCRFVAESDPCPGCEDQCRRLKVSPSELRDLLGRMNVQQMHDPLLNRAIEVGLLTAEAVMA